MNHPFGQLFRLVSPDGPGLSCDEDGVMLGGVALIQRSVHAAERQY
jgi:hypothetical protein